MSICDILWLYFFQFINYNIVKLLKSYERKEVGQFHVSKRVSGW
ncbi:hypothetical protein CSCA_0435 [Clostridium scatologenes]|uniref:Uncharacterized protein n=1 Tax=Clostridium scatologenes TaxID=1548 RepID=A0A0E3JM07_CLOSL|nr:hypothetical protein CSCA_0435 [Clostridium scatologenes]